MRYYCAAQSVIRQAADTFVAGRFGGSEFRRGADFVAQQTMLRCGTNDAALRKAVGGVGVVSSKERSAHLFVETCAVFYGDVHTIS